VFDTEGSNIYSSWVSIRVLIALLCSKLSRYSIKSFIDHTVHAQIEDVNEIRLGKPYPEAESRLHGLVDSIIEKQKFNLRYPYYLHEQKEIDELVYQLYGLSEEDIREIELWYCRRYPRLAEAQGVLAEVQQKYADYLQWCEQIMSKPPSYWKSHPILKLIAQGEGPRLEFKETLEIDVKTGTSNPGVLKATLKTIAAFLNTDGGTLLIGVSDSGEVKGLERDFQLCHRHNQDGFEQKLRSLINDRFEPKPLGKVNIAFEPLVEGTICRVDVQPWSKEDVVHLDKEVYVRDGNVTRKLEGPELTRWLLERARVRAGWRSLT